MTELSVSDLEKARSWHVAHMEHVGRITKNETASYPPSGSDAHNPALWKAAHWNWFLENTVPAETPSNPWWAFWR